MADKPAKKAARAARSGGKAPSRAKGTPRKPPAPRTKGTPAKPPAPRKVAAPAKPKAARPRAPPAEPNAPQWVPVTPPAGPPAAPGWPPQADGRWAPATGPGARMLAPSATNAQAPQWLPAPAPVPTTPPRPAPPRPFDPTTGAWLPAPGATAEAGQAVDPAARSKGALAIVMHILLGIDLALLGLNFLLQIVVGAVLLWAPDSAFGQRIQEYMGGATSPEAIIANALLSFLMIGLIPFIWVLGTRVSPWRGTVKFLNLRVGWKDLLVGVALVPLMILAVYLLVIAYTCAIDGCGALDDPPEEDSPLQEMLSNLTWPVVIVVALAAGIGEEILFRGVLQRWIGVWGQGVAFGLAHAVNAYPPQVIFAFGLGVVFGYLYKRGWSLVSLMVAHFLYDFVLLALAMLYPELG